MEIVDKDWLEHFLNELKNTSSLKIISPFITQNLVNHLLKNWKGKNIQVITRFNLNDFKTGVSSLYALKKLVTYNVQIKGIKGLHSKTYIFDNNAVIITSANFTNGGFFNNYELGIKSLDPKTVTLSNEYFDKLWLLDDTSLSMETIDLWLDELKNIVPIKVDKLKDYGVSPIKKILGNKSYFIKFYGRGHERANWNENVKDLVKGTHCHFAVTFPDPNRRPRRYKDGDIIYMARMITEQEYAIFGKAIAIKHNDKTDLASEEDINQIEWKKRYPVYIRVHSCEFLDTSLGNCPMMGKLMDELGYECFEKTKQRHSWGEDNINPRNSYRQKPDVKLSEEGAFWIEQKFQQSKKTYNLIAEDFISNLYQGTSLQ